MGQTARVYPARLPRHGWAPHWAHLPPGFHCLVTPRSEKFWCYVAKIGNVVYALLLSMHDSGKCILCLRLEDSFHQAFRPISSLLEAAGVPDNCTSLAYHLEVGAVSFSQDCVFLTVKCAELVSKAAPRHSHSVPDANEGQEEEDVDLDF